MGLTAGRHITEEHKPDGERRGGDPAAFSLDRKEHRNMKNEEEKRELTAEELRELFRELPDGQMCIVSFEDGEEGGGEDGI